MKVYKIESEWDLGIYSLFSHSQKAHKWLESNISNFGFEESLEDLLKSNLIQIKEIEVLTEGTVTISKEMYDELVDDQALLHCLKAVGVDNWEGYDTAMEMFEDN